MASKNFATNNFATIEAPLRAIPLNDRFSLTNSSASHSNYAWLVPNSEVMEGVAVGQMGQIVALDAPIIDSNDEYDPHNGIDGNDGKDTSCNANATTASTKTSDIMDTVSLSLFFQMGKILKDDQSNSIRHKSAKCGNVIELQLRKKID